MSKSHKAFVVCDMGMGDSGKGTLTEALVRKHKINLVVRYSGGSNCAHNVILEKGTHHTFSTWGSGTFAGAKTLLTKDVLIDPIRLYNEGLVLAQKGVSDPFDRMIIDENALVITPFHGIVNRLREISRTQDGKHGSCGIGIGETARYALEHFDSALRMGDLLDPVVLIGKLYAIKDNLMKTVLELNELHWHKAGFMREKQEFFNDHLINSILWGYYQLTHTRVGNSIYSTSRILDWIAAEDSVWEGAQGVLLDEDVGFWPNVTWSRTRLINAAETLEQAGITDVTNVGVLRVYGHRHGPGPFPSEDESIRPLVQEPHNGTNQWQKEFRVGWFDMVLADYAKRAAGYGLRAGHPFGRIHELALTHLDRLPGRSAWPVVMDYGLDMSSIVPHDDFNKRQRLTDALMDCHVNRVVQHVSADFVPHFITEHLNLPVTIKSFGPTYLQKSFHA